MVAAGSGGHDWVITSENKNNLLASCRRCTLFVQQVHKPAVFDRIEAHPCLGREQPVPEGAGVHPSHNMVNVGRAWICKHCFIQLWVAYEKIPQGVAQQCRPSRKQARGGGGQLAPFLPIEHRPSWLQTEQQPATVPPRSKNRFRSKSVSPSRKEPPKLHSFFATPPLPLPAAACLPQDLGSREVGSKQQHNQQPASQPHTQPDTLLPGSSPGKELEVSQAGCSLDPALRSPPPSLPTGSRKGSRRDEGTSPIARFFAQWPGTGSGSGATTPKNGDGDGCGDPTTTNGGATLQEHWDGTAAPSQEEQGGGPRRRGKKQYKPSAIRQDRELEAAYQRVAAKRAEQRPDAPRLSRSSYMRNRSRPPKAVRAAKGGGKDHSGNQPAPQAGAPPGVRPPPPKPGRKEPVAAEAPWW